MLYLDTLFRLGNVIELSSLGMFCRMKIAARVLIFDQAQVQENNERTCLYFK